MAEFTPGPWHYDTKKYALVGSNGKPVRFYGEGITIVMAEPNDEERANWHVAKTAPELLEALKGLLEWTSPRDIEGANSTKLLAIVRAQNVIAKAEAAHD